MTRRMKLNIIVAALSLASALGFAMVKPRPTAAVSCSGCSQYFEPADQMYRHRAFPLFVNKWHEKYAAHTNHYEWEDDPCTAWHQNYAGGGGGDGDGDGDGDLSPGS